MQAGCNRVAEGRVHSSACVNEFSSSRQSHRGPSGLKKGIQGLAIAIALVVASNSIHPLRAGSPTNFFEAPGTAEMARLLEEIAEKVNLFENPFQNELLSRRLGAEYARAANGREQFQILREYSKQLLYAGRSTEAIKAFEELEALIQKLDPGFLQLGHATNKLILRSYLATAHLRLAEQDNCLTNHTAESCLFPIAGTGVHKTERGSRAAIKVLNTLLDEFPGELGARWLLNLAHMTLGEYPEKVPAPWLIPPKTFESDYDIKRFVDVAGNLGLDVENLSGGTILDDLDNDGYLDLVTSSIGLRDPLHYFHNNGNGTFTERTREAGLTGEVGGLNLIQADYNNDGFVDFLVLRGGWMGRSGRHPKSLLRNNGNGTFTDVTKAAGLMSLHPTQTAVWFDYNHDGWVDLFVGHESNANDRNRSELFRNNGDGTFTECGDLAGLRHYGFVKGVVSGDFNNDGWPDLYLSQIGEPNVLFRNDGPANPSLGPKSSWRFTNVARAAGVTEPLWSFPTWFFDYDNDGWLDIFVIGYRPTIVADIAADYLGLPSDGERARLFRNNRDGTFLDVTKATRLDKVLLGMGCNFGDFDNDGWLDMYIGTGNPDLSVLVPNRAFRNAEGKYFQDVTTSGGLGHLQKGHGVAFGDIDQDGDQDVFINLGGAYSGDVYRDALFQNPGHGNHWVVLKLEGVQSNRSAIGARIKVTVDTENGERAIYKTVGSGGSFGCSPLRQEFGLGQAKSIRQVEVFWPVTRKTQIFRSLELDRMYK
ncbi:MAG: CRTAC1 family protein, partial [Verrucomicrobia bacterium]|nr:CRTAC1 family protein [Verrucomicrobiota bacterium]